MQFQICFGPAKQGADYPIKLYEGKKDMLMVNM